MTRSRRSAISANGECEIGRMIAKAMQKVGNEGVITVEEAKSLKTELDVVEGMQFDRGYLSLCFVTRAAAQGAARFAWPAVGNRLGASRPRTLR